MDKLNNDRREVEKKLRKGIEVDLGRHNCQMNVNGSVRSEFKEEITHLEREEGLPDSINFNEALMILVGRSRNFRDRREDPNVRETMKK